MTAQLTPEQVSGLREELAVPGPAKRGEARLHRLDVGRMVREEPPAVPWVVEGLVARGMLTLLAGREGEGKSLLATALAAGVTIGEDEAGMVCHRGRALIVDAENGSYEIHRRVHALGLSPEGLEVYETEGFDLRSDLAELERVLERHRPDFLVLDSFRSLWGGKENDSGEAAAVLDPLRNLVRRFDAGTLMLHHSGKSTGEYRGNSAIGASAEFVFKLAKVAEDPERRVRRYLETGKCRPAPEPEKRWLRLEVERGQVYVDRADPFECHEEEEDDRPVAPVREELRPQILGALATEPRSRADVARSVGREPKDRSVGRVLKELERDGAAERSEEGWRRVADRGTPIGSRHSATTPANPHARAETGGGRPVATLDGLPLGGAR
jgi:archaellum biogenesis ATPase FlaH